jgi:hypothetical protein
MLHVKLNFYQTVSSVTSGITSTFHKNYHLFMKIALVVKKKAPNKLLYNLYV